MIRYILGLTLGWPIVACSAPTNKIAVSMKISTVTGCPVALMSYRNSSGTTIFLGKEAPLLSIVDELGRSARYASSPGYMPDIDISDYISLRAGRTHVYTIKVGRDYALKAGRKYTVTAGGGEFTDPITHKHVVVSTERREFRYSANCSTH